MCPQDIARYRDVYPEENLRFFADVYGVARDAVGNRVKELIELLELEPYARTRVSALSGGWQRRVNFAVALVHGPDVLILDEPTSAVDLEARQDLLRLIEALNTSGMTILLTTGAGVPKEHASS